MPLLVHALFYLAYLVIAIAIAAALAVVGDATGAEATLGGISFFGAFAVTHAAITAAHAAGIVKQTEARLNGEIDKVRRLHKEIAEDVTVVAERLDKLDDAVTDIAHRRVEAPAPQTDYRALEAIVDKLGRTLDARFEDMRRTMLPAPTTPARAPSPIEIVREALNENRVELHLQPTVSLPQRRNAFYEGYSRLRDADGRIIQPSEFIPAAESAGLMAWIDNVLLFRAVQIVRRLMQQDKRVAIFCNVSLRSFADEQFFGQFLELLHSNKDLSGALIFEIGQDAFDTRTSVHARAMGKLLDLGFRFSVDRVSRVDVDLADLERAGVKFFKAPGSLLSELIVAQGQRPKSNIARELGAADVSAVFRRYGIDLIAERIEHEGLVAELIDLDIPFAQGNLFGPPRPIKDSLMAETAPPKDWIRQARG
ncbi:MAG: EAL domain-containing protein [Caulobacterales bacterium]|jgi:cyclic-di-GMP phosphodiesterase TipF (flagellum assembly factor)